MKANDSFASFALWIRNVSAAEKSIETSLDAMDQMSSDATSEIAHSPEKRHLTVEL